MAIDETNTRVDIPALLAKFAHTGFRNGRAGRRPVQPVSPRARHRPALPRRELAVAMGGFHVSGCLAMLDGNAVGLDACREMGISMFAGEAEGRFDTVLRDAASGQFAPMYDFMKDLPGIEGMPVPFLPKSTSNTQWASARVSMRAAAAPINARFAPSSTCRVGNHASARQMTWRSWCG